jgi:GMP reductase
MRIADGIKLDFNDVLIVPKRSTLRTRKDVQLERTYNFKHSKFEWTGIPIMASNMDTVGTFKLHQSLANYKMFTVLHKHYSVESWKKEIFYLNYGAPSIGANDKDFEIFKEIFAYGTNWPRFICVDVANGYGEYFPGFISKIRNLFPDLTIMAGNVVTAEMTEQLILSGADIVKVGIGPGSVCTTRMQTGVGYPQLSAVIECADAAHGLGGHIISDGGCRVPGDVAKAFGAGADFVMLGGMFAGHEENTEATIDGKVDFYGMASKTANVKYSGELAEYRSAEGRHVQIEFKGPVANTVQSILGGLRSTCTYVGAPTLKQLSKCTTFIRVTQQHNSY